MATVTLYHDTRSGKDTFPVKLRIAHKKEKAYILLGIKVALDEWDNETCRIIGNKNAKAYNATLIARLGAASSHIANLDLLGKTNKLSASQIRDIIENGEDKEQLSTGTHQSGEVRPSTQRKNI